MSTEQLLALVYIISLTFSCQSSTFRSEDPGGKRGDGEGEQDGEDPSAARDLFDDDDETRIDSDVDGEDDEDDGSTSDTDSDAEGDRRLDIDEGELVHEPKRCTSANGKIALSGQRCPESSAAFLSDDGSTTRVGCCLLPSRDILDEDSTPEVRNGACRADEIAVGASGNGFYCQRINSQRYRLSAPQPLCYWGDGASGGQNADACKNAELQLQELIRLTGDRDGCVAVPYGAVVVSKSSKRCADQRGAQILHKDSGEPVKMFP